MRFMILVKATKDSLRELISIRTRTDGAVDFRNLRSTNR